jgi:hypothetical protein
MNPVLLKKSRIFNIGSFGSNKNNGSKNSNITVPLPSIVSRSDTNIKNVYFSVIHAEIPNSFYLINSTNNTIIVNSITYTIPPGNYNINSLMTAIKTVLPVGFTLTYNSTYLKYTFGYTTTFTISKYSTINKIIGGSTTGGMVSLANSLTLPFVVNLLPIPRINIHSRQLLFGNFNQGDTSSDMFLSIQNNGGLGNMILYNNITGLIYKFEGDNLSNIDIRITDDYNNELDLNSQDFYICFQIDIEYLYIPQTTSFSQIVNSSQIPLP